MKKLILVLASLIGFASVSLGFETHGDVTLSKIKEYKSFFTKSVCDQVLTDTFTICYSHDRKSPTAVYVEVTGDTVEKDIDTAEIEKIALRSEIVIKALNGHSPKKVIVIPGRIVNVVI